MQVDTFITYLDKPTLISDENEIKAMVNEFPYCQTTHLMYAHQLNRSNSILFEEQLKKTATYCTDRRKLFEQLHEEQMIVLETKNETLIPEPSRKDDAINELEKGYLTEAINSTILLESDEVVPTEIPEKSSKDDDVIEQDLFNSQSEHSFSDWLRHYNGEDLTSETTEERNQKLSNLNLIDNFIQEDPQIKPKETSFYSPANMARLSILDDSSLVSETLALVHVEQKNYQEAIKAYQKLSLKNPEKSTYFANQIKILKQKIK